MESEEKEEEEVKERKGGLDSCRGTMDTCIGEGIGEEPEGGGGHRYLSLPSIVFISPSHLSHLVT